MTVTRQVSDAEFNAALANIDNIRIMDSAIHKYKNVIPKDELQRCKLIALWSALSNFDINNKCKFTSFLYLLVWRECKKYYTSMKRHSNNIGSKYLMTVIDKASDKDSINMNEIMSLLSPTQSSLIEQRYIKNMTLAEIGQANGYSNETARKKIKAALTELRTNWRII